MVENWSVALWKQHDPVHTFKATATQWDKFNFDTGIDAADALKNLAKLIGLNLENLLRAFGLEP